MGGGGGGGGPSISHKHGGKHTNRVRRNQYVSGGLMLASMLDILMAILFFLMKNYSEAKTDFNVGKDISLPYSSAITPPVPALQLVVTKNEVMLDNQKIADIESGDIAKKDMYRDGVTILPLAQALKKQKDRSTYIQKHNDDHSFTGQIVLQADKGLQFSVLKKVIYTAGISDFVMLKLAVLNKEEI